MGSVDHVIHELLRLGDPHFRLNHYVRDGYPSSLARRHSKDLALKERPVTDGRLELLKTEGIEGLVDSPFIDPVEGSFPKYAEGAQHSSNCNNKEKEKKKREPAEEHHSNKH